MHTTNYRDTLITVSPDCPLPASFVPEKPGTVAERQYARLAEAPYGLTSDALLLAVENDRKGPVTAEDFFARPKACLRASPLVKRFGFGLHHDSAGRVALVPVESDAYARLLADDAVTKVAGMRSARA